MLKDRGLHTRRSFGFASFAAILIFSPFGASCHGASIVVPNSSVGVEGDGSNRVPAFEGRTIRVQQVFASSQFDAFLGAEPITSIAFRPEQTVSSSPARIPSFQVSLSTTSKPPDGLSEVFVDNVGDDVTVVFDGVWTLFSDHIGTPRNFDVVLNLQTPFIYDPSLGNLLLDMKSIESATADFGLDGLNVIGDSVSRVVSLDADPALGVNSPIGTTASFGLIVQFTTPSCDFDEDGRCNNTDLDLLYAVVSGTAAPLRIFDLTGDDRVDRNDVTQWLAKAANENGFGSPYLRGDANLDGAVNSTDLNLLGVNWQIADATSWAQGDFNGDGKTNSTDLNDIGLNWRYTIPLPATARGIPEPTAGTLAVFALAAIACMPWRHRQN